MKQKTAMQELIEELEKVMPQFECAPFDYAIGTAKQLLEKEKQQIIDAKDCWMEDERYGDEYFNQTYNSNE